MSFDISIGDPTESIGYQAWTDGLNRALATTGATVTADNMNIVTRNGCEHEWHGTEESETSIGCGIAIRKLDEEICALIFEIANETRAHIFIPSEQVQVMKPPTCPYFDFDVPELRIVDLSEPADVFRLLSTGYDNWRRYRDQVIRNTNQ